MVLDFETFSLRFDRNIALKVVKVEELILLNNDYFLLENPFLYPENVAFEIVINLKKCKLIENDPKTTTTKF